MSASSIQTTANESATGQLSREIVLDVLSNERRRYVVHYLKYQGNRKVDLGELAERVAAWELDKPVERLDYRERKRVKNALQQFHLPKMEEAGFVEYDDRAGTVELAEFAAEQDFYVDVLPQRGVPWGLYYLGFSGLSLTVLTGLSLSVPPISAIDPLEWFVFFVTALVVSSVAHFYDNYYRMRLGARETPPGVGES